jgi:tight adherence protein B
MTTYPLTIGIVVAMAVAVVLIGLYRALEPSGEVEQRIESWVRAGGKTKKREVSEAGDGGSVLLSRVERSIARRSFAEDIRADLARADLSLTVSEYLLIRGGVVGGGAAIGYLLQRNLLTALVLAAVGYVLPIFYVRVRQGRRLQAFNRQLPDILDHLVGSLRAGYGLLQAVEWVAKQMPHPAGTEFDRVIREVALGRSLSDGLDSLVRRIDSDDLALIITAIKIQYEVGGSLADILETVGVTIRERVRIQREVGVLTAQQRYSGYVLMLLPIALGIVLFLLNPEYEMQLFTPGPTLCIPIGTALLMILGFFVMRRIVNIEV